LACSGRWSCSGRSGRIATADQQVGVAELAAADRERTLDGAVRMQYGRAAAAIREAQVAAVLADTVERQVAAVRARIDEGETPRLDGDLLEVELRRLRANGTSPKGAPSARCSP
jgi:outer membrane protein TolC